MKKFFKFSSFVITLLLIIAIAFPLTACGNEEESAPEKSSQRAVAPQTHKVQNSDSTPTQNGGTNDVNSNENKSIEDPGVNSKTKIVRKNSKRAIYNQNDVSRNQANYQTASEQAITPTAEPSYFWYIFTVALIVLVMSAAVLFIYYKICVGFDILEEHLKTSISNLLRKQSNFSYNRDNESQTANLISQSEKRIYNAVQYLDQKTDQLYTDMQKYIYSAVAPISESLSSHTFVSALTQYSEQTTDINAKLTSIISMTPAISEINIQMQKLISEKPELVNLSIKTATELVKQCQLEGISTASQVKEVAAIFNKCKELNFSSIAEIAESKQYYDARIAHTEESDNLKKKINDLEEDKASLRQELNTLQQKHMTVCPDEIQADALINLLKDTSTELRAETLALVIQLYWFAQLFRNTPNKIKAAFMRFDDTLYELFSEEQELLQAIRQTIQNFLNTEVFNGTSYEVFWPMLNSYASEHEDHYNRENDEGNRICKIRSAVIINAGNVESVARIYTSL